MEEIPVIVPDCNILIAAALLTGPPFSLPMLNRMCMRLFAETDTGGQSALAMLAAFSTVGIIRYGTGAHIIDTVEYKLIHDGDWDMEDAAQYVSMVEELLIRASGGPIIGEVPEGWMRMGDHEDTLVYETCRRISETTGRNVLLLTADLDFGRRVDTVNRQGPPWDRVYSISPPVFTRNITRFTSSL